jgi:hypothetical protein
MRKTNPADTAPSATLPKVITKSPGASKRQGAAALKLPENIHLTEEERSSVAQWIRLRRNSRIWTGALIQALLDWDSERTTDPGTDNVIAMVCEVVRFKIGFESACSGQVQYVRTPKSEHRALTRFFAEELEEARVLGDTGDLEFITPKSEEDEFYQLLRLWRLEHPEPPPKRDFPKGHLGRSDDDDD